MPQPMIDPDALVTMFEEASAKQGAQLQKAVTDATLAALQGRELTLKNLRAALKAVAEAASTGAARNASGVDPATLLDTAVAGMDAAVLKAVEAHRVALGQLVTQGADLREKHLKKAVDDLDKMEDAMFSAMRKAADGAGAPMAGAWGQVLEKFQAGGSASGAQASAAAESALQMAEQMRETMRSTRNASLRAAQAMAESYAALAGGVLLGMSEAMGAAAGAPAGDAPRTAAKARPGKAA